MGKLDGKIARSSRWASIRSASGWCRWRPTSTAP